MTKHESSMTTMLLYSMLLGKLKDYCLAFVFFYIDWEVRIKFLLSDFKLHTKMYLKFLADDRYEWQSMQLRILIFPL